MKNQPICAVHFDLIFLLKYRTALENAKVINRVIAALKGGFVPEAIKTDLDIQIADVNQQILKLNCHN